MAASANCVTFAFDKSNVTSKRLRQQLNFCDRSHRPSFYCHLMTCRLFHASAGQACLWAADGHYILANIVKCTKVGEKLYENKVVVGKKGRVSERAAPAEPRQEQI